MPVWNANIVTVRVLPNNNTESPAVCFNFNGIYCSSDMHKCCVFSNADISSMLAVIVLCAEPVTSLTNAMTPCPRHGQNCSIEYNAVSH